MGVPSECPAALTSFVEDNADHCQEQEKNERNEKLEGIWVHGTGSVLRVASLVA